MFFRDLKPKTDVTLMVYPVHAHLPVRLGNHDASEVFGAPLADRLMAAGLGHVTECRARIRNRTETEGVDLFLSLTSITDDAFATVARILEGLGAPQGSTMRMVDGGPVTTFGRSVGMGVYIDDSRGTDARGVRRMADACVKSMNDAATLAGTARVQDRIAFYFYGDDYAAMRRNLSEGKARHPALRSVVTRRLI